MPHVSKDGDEVRAGVKRADIRLLTPQWAKTVSMASKIVFYLPGLNPSLVRKKIIDVQKINYPSLFKDLFADLNWEEYGQGVGLYLITFEDM